MIFTNGLSAPEGPVALPDGTWLIVEGGADRGCVTHIGVDGSTRRRQEDRAAKRTCRGFAWSNTGRGIEASFAGPVDYGRKVRGGSNWLRRGAFPVPE